MRYLSIVLLVLFLAGAARCDDPPNTLTAKESAEGWILLFDGENASEWRIEGDHQIVDGTLILGGNQLSRATLRRPFRRECELRFHYRTEGTKSAGVGWDFQDKRITGLTLWILDPEVKWRDSFVEEYFDLKHPFQRFIKHQHGLNGTFAPVESVWLEVQPGNKLFLRNLRLREGRPAQWHWFVAFPLFLVGGLLLLFLWWRRRVKRFSPNGRADELPEAAGIPKP